RQDVVLRLHLAIAGERGVDPVGIAAQRGDARAEPHGDAELLAAHAREVLDEQARVAARVAHVANGAGDLALDRLEDRIELGHAAGIEDLLLLPVLGEQRHLLHAGLELSAIPGEIERAPGDRGGLDLLGAHQLAHDRLAVLAEPQLDQRVLSRPVRRALAQEAKSPGVEAVVGPEPQADRRLAAAQRVPQHARRARRGPRERVARRDDSGVAGARLEADPVLLLEDRDLVARLGQEVRRRDADYAAAEHEGFHRITPRGGIRRGPDRWDRRGTG